MPDTSVEQPPVRTPAPPRAVPSPVDIRRKRPPALSFLLRMDTARRAARVVSLLALDFAGVFAAIFTALMVKAVVRDGAWAWDASFVETKESIAFAYLVTALLFARSGLYAERAQRPGLPRIVSSLFQVTVVALIFALVNGEQYSSYYIFYGTLCFAVAYVSTIRWVYEQITGVLLRAAGYRRRAVLVGSGKHIEEVHSALVGEVHAPVDMIGFISLEPRPDNGLRSLGQIEDLPAVLDRHRVQEVIIADPDFPEERAVELVDQCHRRGVTVRIAPSTMEILVHRAEFVPGASVPLFELRPPVFDGFDYLAKRSFDFVGALLLIALLGPLLIAIALAVFITSRGPGPLPLGPARHRRRAVRLLQVPHDALRRGPAPGRSRVLQRGFGGALQDPPRPAHDAGRSLPAPLLARRAAAAVQRRAGPDVAGRAAAATAARLRPARGLAQEALPRAARDDRAVAGVGARGARLRRPRAARFPLPRALVDRSSTSRSCSRRSRRCSRGGALSSSFLRKRASLSGQGVNPPRELMCC
jgi:hypothetical protein